MAEAQPEKPSRTRTVFREAVAIVWRARARLILGLPLMLVNRLSGLVLPWVTKSLIDDVIRSGNQHMLWRLVAEAGVAAAVSSVTDYSLAQILGIAAQRSITELRVRLQQHVQRLPFPTSTPRRPACWWRAS